MNVNEPPSKDLKMGAIDLLLDVKRDSERLHHLVLGALLQRTMLLTRLVPLAGVPTEVQLQWEPEGKAYDIGLNLVFDDQGRGQGATARRHRVLIEIKLDNPLGEDQLAQHLNPSRFHPDDRLLYLMLGYSAITSDFVSLRARVGRIADRTLRPDLPDRISFRDADDLIPLLADPALLPAGSDHNDARDLAAAYRDALLELSDRSRHYASRAVAEWQDADFFGFFAQCRSRGLSGMPHARINRVTSPEGSVVSYTFAEVTLQGGLGAVDLQFENGRLCLRVHASAERKTLRQQVFAAVLAAGLLEAGAEPLGPLTPAPLRLGTTMTVAQRDGLLDGFPDRFDWTRFAAQIAAAEAGLRKVAGILGP